MSLGMSPNEIVERAVSAGNPGLLGSNPAWPRIPISELVQIQNGAPFKSEHFNTNGNGLPLIRIRDVGADAPETYYAGAFDAAFVVTAGDLLVGMDGDFRAATWHGPDGLLNQRVCRLSVRDNRLDQRWLTHILQGYLDAIWAETSSITVKHLSSRTIGQIPIPLPPLAEQHRIVEALEVHLSRLDAASGALASVRFRMDALANASALDALQVLPGSELPEGWQWKSLDSLSRGSSYGTSIKCELNGKGTPVVRIPNVRDGALALADMKYAADGGAGLSHLHLKAGDVLFIRTNGSPSLIGRTAVVREDLPIAFASYLIRFQMSAVEIADWVQLVVSSPAWREQIVRAAASSAGQYNLNQAFLKRLHIPLPPTGERARILLNQRESAYNLQRLAEGIVLAQARCEALRRALLTAAFNGELADQDPSDEPAEVALARLRAEAKPARKGTPRRATARSVRG